MALQAVSRDSGTSSHLIGRTGIDRRDVVLAGLCAALALWSYRWALGSYFSPDDLILLERVRGLSAWPHTAWRALSGSIWFGVITRPFGVNALAFFSTSYLLHACTVVLLYALVRRSSGGMLASTIAAALFASSRLFLTVVGQAVGIGDLLALAFTLIAGLSLIRHSASDRWIAPTAFALALLAKENVIALPAAYLALPAVGRDLRDRLTRVAPLLALSIAWAAYLFVGRGSSSVLGGPAYGTSFGVQILRSLGTYASWLVDFVNPAPDFSPTANPMAWVAGAIVIGAAGGLAWIAREKAPLMQFGVVWFVLGIVPVLPLVHQHNLHYLYAPFAGIGIAIGGAFEAAAGSLERRTAWVPWCAAIALVASHAVASDRLMKNRIHDDLWDENVPYDPFVRKVELIRRMSQRVAPLATEPHGRIVIIVPRIEDRLAELWRGLLPGVVDQGRGLRALYPNLDSVAFVERWTPEYRDYQLVAGSVDGMIVGFGAGADAHLRFVETLMRNDFRDEAVQHLRDVARGYPDDARFATALATLAPSTAQPIPQSSSRPSSPPIR